MKRPIHITRPARGVLAPILLIMLAALAWGCSSEPKRDNGCEPGELVELDETLWCIVIEEGFLASDCPPSHPIGQTFGEVVLCGEQTPNPELRDALIEGGYLPEECADDPELGRFYSELDPSACADTPPACADGGVAFENECGCGCISEPSDAGVDADAGGADTGSADAPDVPPDIEPDGRDADRPIDDASDAGAEPDAVPDAIDCDACVCDDGAWDCGGVTPEECGLADPCIACVEPDPSEGCVSCECIGESWACAPTVDCDYDGCIDTCSEEPDPEDPLACGENLFRYSNACERACAGVQAAESHLVCDDLTPVCGQEFPEVELLVWVPPRACTLRSRGGTRVFDSNAAMGVSFDCSEAPGSTGRSTVC